jgi:hypothetical protein
MLHCMASYKKNSSVLWDTTQETFHIFNPGAHRLYSRRGKYSINKIFKVSAGTKFEIS